MTQNSVFFKKFRVLQKYVENSVFFPKNSAFYKSTLKISRFPKNSAFFKNSPFLKSRLLTQNSVFFKKFRVFQKFPGFQVRTFTPLINTQNKYFCKKRYIYMFKNMYNEIRMKYFVKKLYLQA